MASNGFHRHEDDEHDNFHHYSDLDDEATSGEKYQKCDKKDCIVESVRYFQWKLIAIVLEVLVRESFCLKVLRWVGEAEESAHRPDGPGHPVSPGSGKRVPRFGGNVWRCQSKTWMCLMTLIRSPCRWPVKAAPLFPNQIAMNTKLIWFARFMSSWIKTSLDFSIGLLIKQFVTAIQFKVSLCNSGKKYDNLWHEYKICTFLSHKEAYLQFACTCYLHYASIELLTSDLDCIKQFLLSSLTLTS